MLSVLFGHIAGMQSQMQPSATDVDVDVVCPCVCVSLFVTIMVKGKGKVFPYLLPSVGPGADPGVQAVSPQVT